MDAAVDGLARRLKKYLKLGLSVFRVGFNPSKCKTQMKMAVARIKLLRNKRDAVIKQMRRDIASLLQSGQDSTARIRVEHVMREQNVMAANEFLELFCELVVSRLTVIAKRRECPADLKEGIASLIFAAPRCPDIPELLTIRDIFKKKYGKDFVSAATDLRPDSGVNRMLIEKLSVRTPSGQVKLKVMKEIAKEFHVEWDTSESEAELLKPPEELIEGQSTFGSATILPVKPMSSQYVDEPTKPAVRFSDSTQRETVHYEDIASAAEAAAESAKQAIAAAEAAAYLAKKDREASSGYDSKQERVAPFQPRTPNERQSYNAESASSDTDGSDYDEEIEMEEPPDRGHHDPPPVPKSQFNQDQVGVHPKLPDYDELAARFESLKNRKSQN